MATDTIRDGWERLPNGYDVEFRHSIPYRLADNGKQQNIPDPILLEEISSLGKLHVQIGQWETGDRPDEHEARLYASDREFAEVLHRLALSSAALFVDRYHKPLDDSDVDWDRLEYLKDFHTALDYCRLDHGDIDPDAYRDAYVTSMHRETRRLAQSHMPPLVEPE